MHIFNYLFTISHECLYKGLYDISNALYNTWSFLGLFTKMFATNDHDIDKCLLSIPI